MVGFTPFGAELSKAFSRYFEDAGFEVLRMSKPVAEDQDVPDEMSLNDIRASVVKAFKATPGKPEALYILSSGWRVLDVIEQSEADLGVPVLQPVVVRCWYILQKLGRSTRYERKGRLLAEMPTFPAA